MKQNEKKRNFPRVKTEKGKPAEKNFRSFRPKREEKPSRPAFRKYGEKAIRTSSVKEESPVTFLQCLEEVSRNMIGSDPEAFAEMPYAKEIALKQKAYELFLRKRECILPAGDIVKAVQPRHYRANSKRRCSMGRQGFRMALSGTLRNRKRGLEISDLEPELHTEIFKFLFERFDAGYLRAAASKLNYCVIRGIEKTALVLNFTEYNAVIIRGVHRLASELKEAFPELTGFFLYLDETRSDYYFETRHTGGKHSGLRKIYGPDYLSVKLNDGKELYYPPVAFSQVNEPMLPRFLQAAEELLEPEKRYNLIDLYCGYGLIGLSMAEKIHSLIGVEIDGPASAEAVRNAMRLYKNRPLRFIKAEVSPSLIRDTLPPAEDPELVVLDPPKNGTARGIVKEISRRKPERVLHIFCGTDTIPDAVGEWRHYGYVPVRCQVLDMFPGTANVETFVLLERKNPSGE